MLEQRIPAKNPATAKRHTINKKLFQLSFFVNKISRPKPAFDVRPAITAPKPIAPFIYIIVIKTETAQLGIKPKIAKNAVCKNKFCAAKVSTPLPTTSNIKFNPTQTAKINKKIIKRI